MPEIKAKEQEYKPIEGQCGTCRFAKEFTPGIFLNGPDDNVNCTNLDHAAFLDEHSDSDAGFIREMKEYGHIMLFRYEAIAEETTRCMHWTKK